MTNQTHETQRSAWQAPFFTGLLGVAVGGAIGAGTGMWWMMGVLGGTFPAIGIAMRAKR